MDSGMFPICGHEGMFFFLCLIYIYIQFMSWVIMENKKQLVSEPCCVNEGSYFHQNPHSGFSFSHWEWNKTHFKTQIKDPERAEGNNRKSKQNKWAYEWIFANKWVFIPANGLGFNGEGVMSSLQCRLEQRRPSVVSFWALLLVAAVTQQRR